MNKKGFTLVELLAVIAILAILVIIALPNIMSMFNDARKNSFTTETKEIYKVAQQQWISDSLFETNEQVYSRCSSCTGKSLDMSGRSQLEYYIKINKAGNVVEYYTTDGTYQYEYNGPKLNIEDIKEVNEVAKLDESNILHISNNGATGGSCQYKLITDNSSFSLTEDVKEICFNPVNDGYAYDNDIYLDYANSAINDYKYTVLIVYISPFTPSSFLRVYSDSAKTNLIAEVTYDDLPQNRTNIAKYLGYKDLLTNYKQVFLGEYSTIYVDKSNEVTYSLRYVKTTHPSHIIYYSSPWITDSSTINSVNNLYENTKDSDEYLNGFDACDGTYCPVNSYKAVFNTGK